MSQYQPKGFAVYMKGVPPDFTDQSLGAQLLPYLEPLHIIDWACDKPRYKSFAILTFLHRREGQTFLRHYGQKPIPGALFGGAQKMRAHLFLLGKPTYCMESDKEADSTLLRVLESRAEERNHPSEHVEELQSHKHVVFKAWEMSCGHYDYRKGLLQYTADIQWLKQEAIANPKVEIPYRTIHEVVISSNPSSLFLTLWEPPKIFLLPHQSDELFPLVGNLSINKSFGAPRPRLRERLSKIPHDSADHGEVLGQSLIYSLILSPEEFASNIERLRENEYLNFATYNAPLVSFGSSYMAEGLASFKSIITKCSQIIPFDTLYQFQALVQNGYLLPHTAQDLLVRLYRSYVISRRTENPETTEVGNSSAQFIFSAHAVKKLFSQIPFPGPHTEATMFDANEIWSLLETNEKEIRQGLTKELFSERARQNLTMVYKVQVTPTRIIFTGPEPEAKNRILRKFPRHTGYFARVQFCDEDGQDLYFNPKVSLEQIYSRFRKVLLDGFSISGRLYKFLGFSHSSLRSHAVWFMAGFVDDNKELRSYATVIPELGDFQGIRAARIGQAFSETPVAVDLNEIQATIKPVPDVKSQDGSRVFSDGVGTISRELLEAIHDKMPKSSTGTCVQIRWAGAKGMLSLDDTIEGCVTPIARKGKLLTYDLEVNVRDSMIKFQSRDRQNLEICDVANKPIPLVLNRQMIKILEDMRVPESWFFKNQNKELDRLRKITAITSNTVTFLKRQKTAEQMGFSQFIRRLQRLNMDYKKDPFLCSIVEAVVLREVRLLKHKSRIPVDQGVTLFGIMDEFKYLDADEVFITFDKQQGASYFDLHGKLVIVTRSPALHPGDIQVRRAIIPPPDHPLRSLSNCIVFSQEGDRDLPSQLSGGDLDGDIYNVIWDPIAVEGCQLEFEPADYPRVAPLDIGRNVTASDMTEFFVKFMATDQLGLIATRHIILADLHEAGTVHDECKLLAEMHSTAVDYSKTGIPVDMSRMASLKRTKYRPDFLAPAPPTNIVDKAEIQFEVPTAPSVEEDEDDDTGPRHKFYKSTKILGKLYRAIDEKKIWKDDIHLVVNRHGSSLWDELFVYIRHQCENLGDVDWKAALDEAHRIRQAYNDQVWTATIDYSDHASKGITELEVFTGTIFNNSGIQTRRQRDTSTRLKDEFDRISKWIEDLIRKHGGFAALELSIACLYAGIVKRGRGGISKRNADDFESFKVIAAHCALRELEIAIQKRNIAEGAAAMSGGFPGVRSGRA
ncbi:hypothetical protein FHL15_009278 [Xylaria flabelliformis]|uniref:RNA-dependent RNA polymerase n=1 Tax=Xylaria flabelliformis TaxID=2512241 RepID=A0A553HPG5_9PEZI|nr:hypothetical protein FHL15_009278 [Xylaria flabelliformis]